MANRIKLKMTISRGMFRLKNTYLNIIDFYASNCLSIGHQTLTIPSPSNITHIAATRALENL